MPLDAEPSENGNVTVDARLDGVLVATVHGEAQGSGRPAYLPHFVSCPDAAGWRHR